MDKKSARHAAFLDIVIIVASEFRFLLRGNHAACIVDGAANEGIPCVYGALRLYVNNQRNGFACCRDDCAKHDVENSGTFGFAAVLVAVALDFPRGLFLLQLPGCVRKIGIDGNCVDASIGLPSMYFSAISFREQSRNSSTKYFRIHASSTLSDRKRLAALS